MEETGFHTCILNNAPQFENLREMSTQLQINSYHLFNISKWSIKWLQLWIVMLIRSRLLNCQQHADVKLFWKPLWFESLLHAVRGSDICVAVLHFDCSLNYIFNGITWWNNNLFLSCSWHIFLLHGVTVRQQQWTLIFSAHTVSLPAALTVRHAIWWRTATAAWCTCLVMYQQNQIYDMMSAVL